MITHGRDAHKNMTTNYMEDKKVLTIRNYMLEVYRFIKRTMDPVIIPIHYALLYMIQSGMYVLSMEFVSVYKKVHFNEAQTILNMIFFPSSTTIDMIKLLIFSVGSFERYWNSRFRLYNDVDIVSKTKRKNEFMVENENEESQSEISQNKAKTLVDMCREKPRSDKKPDHLNEDYVPLDSYRDEDTFSISTKSSTKEIFENSNCPPHIDEMMVIVNKLRRAQEREKFKSSNFDRYVNNSSMLSQEDDKSAVSKSTMSTKSSRLSKTNLIQKRNENSLLNYYKPTGKSKLRQCFKL
jgi:hypothetical protein